LQRGRIPARNCVGFEEELMEEKKGGKVGVPEGFIGGVTCRRG
jgi:hypothetical protein